MSPRASQIGGEDSRRRPAAGTPGLRRHLTIGDQDAYIQFYDWAREELGVSTADIEAAIRPLAETVDLADPEIPHLVFDTPMPLPSGTDFGGALSRDYLMSR